MRIAINGAQTQRAFNEACDIFNVEVKKKDLRVPGFRAGAKLPYKYLYEIFGETQVKEICANLLVQQIQEEAEKTGLMFVGRGRVTNFNGDDFVAGKTHVIDLECDLWPDIVYKGEKGYKGLVVTVEGKPLETEKREQVKMSIRERYKVLEDTEAGHAAQQGDVVVANMQGFEKTSSGGKGAPLPAIAVGDRVEIPLEQGKFMAGFMEGLLGAKVGEVRTVPVQFPVRERGPGASLSGKEAIFEVSVVAVKIKTLPEWNNELAARVREGLTLETLEKEVDDAVRGDNASARDSARNDALAAALVEATVIDKLPESAIEENTQSRFQEMLLDFRDQGTTEAQLEEMSTPENYTKYRKLSRPNVEKVVKLSMAFKDIAEKEGLAVTPEEVEDQYNMISVQATQKGEPVPDKDKARPEIENVLLRNKVFEFLAGHASVTWLESA